MLGHSSGRGRFIRNTRLTGDGSPYPQTSQTRERSENAVRERAIRQSQTWLAGTSSPTLEPPTALAAGYTSPPCASALLSHFPTFILSHFRTICAPSALLHELAHRSFSPHLFLSAQCLNPPTRFLRRIALRFCTNSSRSGRKYRVISMRVFFGRIWRARPHSA